MSTLYIVVVILVLHIQEYLRSIGPTNANFIGNSSVVNGAGNVMLTAALREIWKEWEENGEQQQKTDTVGDC